MNVGFGNVVSGSAEEFDVKIKIIAPLGFFWRKARGFGVVKIRFQKGFAPLRAAHGGEQEGKMPQRAAAKENAFKRLHFVDGVFAKRNRWCVCAVWRFVFAKGGVVEAVKIAANKGAYCERRTVSFPVWACFLKEWTGRVEFRKGRQLLLVRKGKSAVLTGEVKIALGVGLEVTVECRGVGGHVGQKMIDNKGLARCCRYQGEMTACTTTLCAGGVIFPRDSIPFFAVPGLDFLCFVEELFENRRSHDGCLMGELFAGFPVS